MSILSKIKSFFFKKKEEPVPEVPITEEELEQIAESEKNIQDGNIKELKREILEHCIICQEPIYVDDRVRDLNGSKCHKRCVKNIQKRMMNGEHIE